MAAKLIPPPQLKMDIVFLFFSPLTIMHNHNPPGSSDEVSVEQESEDDINSSHTSLDKQAHHRANTTIHVCWHRNTSVSMSDHSLAVEVLLLCPCSHAYAHPSTLHLSLTDLEKPFLHDFPTWLPLSLSGGLVRTPVSLWA